MPTPPPGAATTEGDARATAPPAPPSHTTDGAPRPPAQWPTGRLVSAVARRIERDWNAHLEHWDLNHASLPVLYLLGGGPRSQRELAEASGVTEQTMSRILVRLERTGYIRRHPHAQDRRRHEVVLTDEGRQTLLEAGDPGVAEQMSIRGLSADQVRTLREILGVMLAQRPRDGDPDPAGSPDGAA